MAVAVMVVGCFNFFFFLGGGGDWGVGGIKMKSVFVDETGITRPTHERSPLRIAGLLRQTYCRS